MLILEHSEIDLSRALADFPRELRELPVGDLAFKCGEGETAWVAEMKSASDFAVSLADGHLLDQTSRNHEAGYSWIF